MYRDPYGVPHIEAESEEAAWFALGFEEARDALLLLQVSAKRVRGESVKYLADLAGFPSLQQRLLMDMLVQILGTYPQNHPPDQLRLMFSTGVAGANFYDNCVAFAAGATSTANRCSRRRLARRKRCSASGSAGCPTAEVGST